MDNVLIISYSNKGIDIITQMLDSVACNQIQTANTCEQARKLMIDTQFDLYIINSPVYNDNGLSLAKDLVSTNSYVLFMVKEDIYDYTSNYLNDTGIITISKPINKYILSATLNVLKINSTKLKKLQADNDRLSKELQDIKLINRAKVILITHLNMSEVESHKYIEREAMNSRIPKIDVALKILKTYDI